MKILQSFILFLIVVSIFSCEEKINANKFKIDYNLTESDEAFLDSLQYKTFLYFWNECNPENGLVKDRSTDDSPASIAAVGFAVPAWIIGVERGWITREEAKQRLINLLRFLYNSNQSDDPLATGYRGFYYHFIDMKTGERYWNCELSTIDTAWLIAGIRFAIQYFNLDDKVENEIRALGDSVTYRVDWDWMTLPDTAAHPGAVSMSYRPERGKTNWGWVGLNEAHYLYVLAAGTGYKDAVTAYDSWLSHYNWCESYPGLAHVTFAPLFGHQYSQIFIDYRGIYDKYMLEKGIDYFENSRRATLTQREFMIQNPRGWVGYDSLTWGLTACDGPRNDMPHLDPNKFRGYSARGTAGPCYEDFDDGTIAPTAAGGSIVFAPEVVIPTLRNMLENYSDKGLWGKYGFKDAFNLTVDWYDDDYIGIDQGPILIMIENLRTGLIWEYSMKDPLIKEGLMKLGFKTK